MNNEEVTKIIKEVAEVAHTLATPIDFDMLAIDGLLKKVGTSYYTENIHALPKNVSKKIKTAKSDARWRRTIISKLDSGFSSPNRCSAITRWPELEMGRNSEAASTTPRMNAFSNNRMSKQTSSRAMRIDRIRVPTARRRAPSSLTGHAAASRKGGGIGARRP